MNHDVSCGTLVLGSTGFIGAHLVRRLDQLGCRVYAVSRSEVDATDGNVQRIRGSIDDANLLRGLIARCRCVIHVASLTTPSASATAPELEIENLNSLTRLLSLAHEFPGRQLIYMSSAGAVYGDLAVDVDENAPVRPRSYYGAGKAAAEAFIHACTTTTTWTSIVLRPSNIYGPGQPAGKGFAIVPTLFSCAVEGTPFNVWGDGKTVRDYCYVSDLIDLIVEAATQEKGTKHAIFNAASGETASVLELIAACERSSNRKISVEFRPVRSVDVPHVSLNTDSTQSVYRWKAKITLNEGLDRTWRWFQESIGRKPLINR